MTPTRPVSSNLTLGELMRSDVLRPVAFHAIAGEDRVVDEVRLIDDVEQVLRARPGTVVVLQQAAARTGWAASIALRYAWQRNVRCVICGVEPSSAPAVIGLAQRLSVPLGIHDGDLPNLALALSAIVGQPEADRAQLVARCAKIVSQQTEVPGLLRALEGVLPGVSLSFQRGVAPSEGSGEVRVPLGANDIRGDGVLVARVAHGSVAWTATVRTILEIARSAVIACLAGADLRLVEERRLEAWALDRLLTSAGDPETGTESDGGDSGWRLGPHLIAATLLPREPALHLDIATDLAVAAAWSKDGAGHGPIRYGGGWAVWRTFEVPEPTGFTPSDAERAELLEAAARQARARLHQDVVGLIARLGEPGAGLAAGIGTLGTGAQGLARSLRHAQLAARASRAAGEWGRPDVVTFDDVGAVGFLAAAQNPALEELAGHLLQAVHQAEDGAALVQTLAVYLDCGGSTTRAAQELGVHRNTVLTRIDRVRRLGIDVDGAAGRLGTHLAAHVVLAAGLAPTPDDAASGPDHGI